MNFTALTSDESDRSELKFIAGSAAAKRGSLKYE